MLRQAQWPDTVAHGARLHLEAWIENTGVAPIYRRHHLALCIKQNDAETVLPLPSDARKWLPGDVWIDEHISLPDSLAQGRAMLYVGLVAPGTQCPRVRFANEGLDEAGWLALGAISLI